MPWTRNSKGAHAMKEWDAGFHGISVGYKEKSVHIKTDEMLLSFLAQPEIGSLALSAYILERYQAIFGKLLEISQDSLAIEILAHVFVDKFSNAIYKLINNESIDAENQPAPLRLLEKVRGRTDVIDCGEASVDNNRVVWDALVPFRGLIYRMFGQNA